MISYPKPFLSRAAFSLKRGLAKALMLMAVIVMTLPIAASAEQFVLFDVTFTYTKADADNATPSKSHYYVREPDLSLKRPKDWTAPVDYRNGTTHVRLEVIEKPPGGEPTTWSVCYIPNKGQNHGYGCFNTDVYKEKGVYDKDISMKSFWQNDDIVWSQGIKRMDLVIKDNKNVKAHEREQEKFFPTKVRMTVIQVSAGSRYDPSLVPGLPKATAPEKKETKPAAKTTEAKSEAVVQTVTAALGCCGDAPVAEKK